LIRFFFYAACLLLDTYPESFGKYIFIDCDSLERMPWAGVSSLSREALPYRAFGSDRTQERQIENSRETSSLGQDHMNGCKCAAPCAPLLSLSWGARGEELAFMALTIKNTTRTEIT
jgi:hypothetical protein